VYLGEGSSEYKDPGEFYRRTYITEGLRHLLVGALKRLGGGGGEPGNRASDQPRGRARLLRVPGPVPQSAAHPGCWGGAPGRW